jgi:hypothetical protein
MSDNVKAAALAANLQGEQKKQADDLVKALFVHRELTNLPKDVAGKKAASLPADQQEDLKNKFGSEDPAVKPSRGWLGTAWHYTASYNPVSLAIKGAIEGSDLMTRAYRAIAIPMSEGQIGFAWDKANDKGDKVYNEGRIEKAKAMYGEAAVDLAMRIKSGEDPAKIWESATPEQQKYLMLDDPTNKVIPGVTNVEEERALWNETLGVVDRSKFSPGRQLANFLLPEQLEKSGLTYTLTSGLVDTLYRFYADPLVVASKIRSLYMIGKYSLDVVVGGGKVADYFAKPATINFWDTYGAQLSKVAEAQNSGASAQALTAARREVEIMAPQFGPEVVRSFLKNNVTDANSAKAYFLNTEEAVTILKGSSERKRVLLPTMTQAPGTKFIPGTRAFRINLVTTADKVINMDKYAPRIVDDIFGGPSTTDGIVKTLSEDGALIGQRIKEINSAKNVLRPSMQQVALRIDKFKSKFNIAPLFKDDTFDVTSKDASTQVYRFARLVMQKQDAKMISATFESIDDIGKRKEMVKGIWDTIAEVRGLKLTEAGQKLGGTTLNSGKGRFATNNFADDFADIGVIPSDFNPAMTMPSIVDIDRAAARSGLIGKMMNNANKEWVDKMTGYWSFLTLAGPRYAVRNAGEDLMVHLAVGGSPWGLAKSRYLSTRVNTALEAARVSGSWNDNALGSVMRILNKKEAAKYEAQIAAVDDMIRNSKEQLNIKSAEFKAATDPATKAAIGAEIAAIRSATAGGATQQTRVIMAQALTSGRVNRYREALGMKPMFDEEAAILAEHLVYGNLDNTMGLVGEGASNFATGADIVTRSTVFTRQHGVRSEALIITDPKAKKYAIKKGGGEYKPRGLRSQDEGAMIAWLMRMNYYANDNLGAIAIANLDDKGVAVAKIQDWMAKNPSFRKEAQLEAQGIDEQMHAEIIYNRAKEIFEKSGTPNKDINIDLLNKIRIQNADGDWVISGKMTLDDLPKSSDDIPEYILGPELVPISDSGQVTSSTITKGWTWLGMANARMSRQPIVLEEIIRMRKQMKATGLEAKYIESVVSKVDNTNPTKVANATERAKRQFAEIIEERAVAQTLAYVDNPLIRTQIAFSVRNFSRFYRATEDFYRRIYRVVRYNPMAIRKAALTFDGISHNGWIQEDDQGEKYFVYPGLEPIYRAVQGAMQAVGIDSEFKTPMPIEFGAQVKMLTPSLNQDSLIPTFNGPLAGISIKTISNIVDIGFNQPGAADRIVELGLGKYAVGQSYLSAFLPAHVNRIYEAMDKDERDSQYASAWRKAVTYLEAAGHGLPKEYDEFGNLIPPSVEAQELYRQQVKNTTLSILGTRFLLGFALPASPQVQLKDDMAAWVRDNGKVNYKQAWNGLLSEYDMDYDKAMAKWVELFPNQIPFTVPESEKKTVAIIGYAEEAGAFVEQNEDLFKKYPQGAAFLMPHKGGFSWDAYKTMKDMGLKYNKRVDDYLREVQTAADLQTYYGKKNEYETNLETMPTDFERSMARKEFQDWAKIFKAGRPLVQEELAQGGQKAIQRQNAINDLRNMLNDKNVTVRGSIQKSLKNMLDLYDSFQMQKDALSNVSGTTNLVSFMKDDTILQMRELAKKNENTKSAYNTLFASLLGDTNG